MRSRYSGYALGLVDYIVQTAATASDKEAIRQFCETTSFDGLDILDTSESGDRGTVTFVAHLSQGGEDCSFKEKSLFEKREGRWIYLSGDVSADLK